MAAALDLTGKSFGLLTVLKRVENNRHGKAMWLCACACGAQKAIIASKLVIGESKSCGCRRVTVAIENFSTHGRYGTPAHTSWIAMLARCRNPNSTAYKNYGARGVKVCARWLKFEHFYADMGNRPAGTSLDRIDNHGNYEPGNCRWATRVQQSHNSRRPRLLTLNGKTDSISGWARSLGIHEVSLWERLERGWPIEVALSTKRAHRFRSPMQTSRPQNI